MKKYDLIIIGGGSGGLSCAVEASYLGAKVALINNSDSLGGTCVNYGCVPKKLMHQAAFYGNISPKYGWEGKRTHNWKKLVSNIQKYIKRVNEEYRKELRIVNVDFYKGKATYITPHKIECNNNGKKSTLECKKSVIAVGGRPNYLGVPGDHHCITSDDLFSLKRKPGKTLVIGGSYIALECAGFLQGLDNDCTVMTRSQYLKGFDEECVSLVLQDMKNKGIKFIKGIPQEFSKKGKKIEVNYIQDNKEKYDEFDTVLLAVGRSPNTDYNTIGLKVNEKGKIISSPNKAPGFTESTSHPDIFAVGDILEDGIELATVAIMAGKLLAQRLFNKSSVRMDYSIVPTTVFTPIEFSSVGLSESEARKKTKDVEIFYRKFNSMEMNFEGVPPFSCLCKIVVVKGKIKGMQLVCPNSGEIIQGFSFAINNGVGMFEDIVGIHPTTAEEIFKVKSRMAGC